MIRHPPFDNLFSGLCLLLLIFSGCARDHLAVSDANAALFRAIQQNDLQQLTSLIRAGSNPNCTIHNGWTPLLFASYQGRTEMVKFLLSAGSVVNAVSISGKTPLIVASEFGHASVVSLLLKAGADPKIAEETGETALIHACVEGHLEVVKLLFNSGVTKSDLTSSLIAAVGQERVEIVEFLLRNGVDSRRKNRFGITPLVVAYHKNQISLIRLLKRYGAT